jgi:hypothetical protein
MELQYQVLLARSARAERRDLILGPKRCRRALVPRPPNLTHHSIAS